MQTTEIKISVFNGNSIENAVYVLSKGQEYRQSPLATMPELLRHKRSESFIIRSKGGCKYPFCFGQTQTVFSRFCHRVRNHRKLPQNVLTTLADSFTRKG